MKQKHAKSDLGFALNVMSNSNCTKSESTKII